VSGSFNSGGVHMEQQDGDGLLLVEGYGDGGFRFFGQRVEGSVLVTENGYCPMDLSEISALTEKHIEEATKEVKPEILLIGTGEKMALLPAALRKSLEQAGIGYELMDTGAAARTFNVLRMEDRRVTAILVQVA
jgi:uncharacterized protein